MREYGGHAGADRSLTWVESTFSLKEGHMADQYSRNIGNAVM
jgi:hypothetical protein